MTMERQIDRVTESGSGREPAICELRCDNCGDGMRFDQKACATCGDTNPRYREMTFDSRLPKTAKGIG